uniref:Uncharacterized protein n=1 Tax=Arundo donax TaxID=35708 RepID=A0A0A9AQE0_ARUDO
MFSRCNFGSIIFPWINCCEAFTFLITHKAPVHQKSSSHV